MIELENTCELAAVSTITDASSSAAHWADDLCLHSKILPVSLKCSRDRCVPCKDWMRAR